jgi:predicted acyl esterase
MYGTSYSGFNSIQLAMERPPALGAICAIYATDDRYTDDVHYTGGVLRCIDLVDYVLYMAAMNVLPPVPSVFGDGWRDEWLGRIESAEPWLLHWLDEQVDSPYWRHGSLRPDYARIACPTMIVAGWADGYRNNTFRTFEALECPKRLLVGPWSHMSTATSLPGPHIDLVPELIRWFPPLALRRGERRRDGAADQRLRQALDEAGARPGRAARRLALGARVAARTRSRPDVHAGSRAAAPTRSRSRATSATSAWISCAGRLPWGQASDQREDDAPFARLRMAARGRARDPGTPGSLGDDRVLGARRPAVGSASATSSRRNVRARVPRSPQPDPPSLVDGPGGPRAGNGH